MAEPTATPLRVIDGDLSSRREKAVMIRGRLEKHLTEVAAMIDEAEAMGLMATFQIMRVGGKNQIYILQVADVY